MRKFNSIVFIFIVLLGCSCSFFGKKTENKSGVESQAVAAKKDSLPQYDTLSAPIYSVYCNKVYSYCISYPATLLFPQKESESAETQLFLSADKRASLRVYNDAREILKIRVFHLEMAYNEDLYAQPEPGIEKTILSNRLDDNWYYISGKINNEIFYQKTLYSNNKLLTAVFRYPERDKNLYDNLIEPIFSTFK